MTYEVVGRQFWRVNKDHLETMMMMTMMAVVILVLEDGDKQHWGYGEFMRSGVTSIKCWWWYLGFFLFGKDDDSQHGVHWDQVGQVMEDQQGTSKSFQQLKQTWDDYKHITNYNVLLWI